MTEKVNSKSIVSETGSFWVRLDKTQFVTAFVKLVYVLFVYIWPS